MGCPWCGYNTDAVDAEWCAECGAELTDRDRVYRLLETKSGLSRMCLMMTVVCVGLTFAWFNAQKENLFELGFFGAVAIGIVAACLWSGLRVWRGLKEHGKSHPKRSSVLLYLLAFAGQLAVLGFFQLVATVLLWQL